MRGGNGVACVAQWRPARLKPRCSQRRISSRGVAARPVALARRISKRDNPSERNENARLAGRLHSGWLLQHQEKPRLSVARHRNGLALIGWPQRPKQ